LSGSWSVTSAPQWLGRVRLRRESGDLVVGVGIGETAKLGLENLTIAADLSPSAIALEGHIAAALAKADVRGRVLPAGSGADAAYGPASPIEFTAEVDVERLAPLAGYIQTTMLIGGEAHARVQARGTLRDPDVTGTIVGRRLSLALPAEGVAYTQGSLEATVTREMIRLDKFSIRGAEGTLTAQGTLARLGFNEASVDWRAQRFTALARPDRRLVVSGRGNARLDAGKVSLTGQLSADEGRFEIGGTSLPQLGDDVVIVGRPAEMEKPDAKRFKAFALDLNVSLGERVHVLGRGLSVWLSGDVRVFTNKQGEMRAEGTVNARNGTFAAYGQRLEIDRGFIYFNGPITDPALEIVAVRRRLAVEPGVAITGTLRNPVVRVTSDPPLPQGEALAWLLLGRSPDQAGAGELSALPLAQAALLGKATGSIARRLNLDELGLRSGGADQFLTLGKRLTDRVYLTFEQGLGAAESLLRLEFTLTRHVVLRAQAGETSLLGLFYRHRWD
jgi:translocation and assembly module TamB